MIARLFFITVGLTIGNFIFQAVDAGDWSRAIERSVFQWAAIALVWFACARKEPTP